MKGILVSILIYLGLAGPAYACSMFCFTVDGKTLVGNNEDFTDPNTWMWTKTAKKGEYGQVYFGFGNFFAQGGINEAGLVFDGFAMEPRKIKNNLDKKSIHPAKLIHKIMRTCSRVAEVQKIMEGENLGFMENAQLMFVDKYGHSLIVEGDDMILSQKPYQIATNFYQSTTPQADFHKVCHRYAAGEEQLSSGMAYSVSYAKGVLEAMHQEGFWGGTQYSHVYDLTEGKIYLYLFHNFEEQVELSVEELLKQGNKKTQLRSLFSQTEEYDQFQAACDSTRLLMDRLPKLKELARVEKTVERLSDYPETLILGQELFAAAASFQEAEEYALSVPVIACIQSLVPQSWRAHAMMAKSYLVLDKPKAAMEQIEAALKLNPQDAQLQAAKEKIREKLDTE